MEIRFQKTSCQYLRKVVSDIQSREELQEIKLADSLPDIGKVLGCWGQILIRSKEWRSDSLRVSGGVMVWALYAPEDGSEERSVESWIPFQLKWDLQDSNRDGSICVMPFLQCVDARSVSARKLMIRACVSVKGEALEPSESELYLPEGVPEEVQMLTGTYPVEMPLEAGEKLFQMEEMLELPNNVPAIDKIIRYEVSPSVLEDKIMAGRLVFRGGMTVHVLYRGDNGIYCWDTEVPFSQYTELDKEYGPNGNAMVIPILTASELEKTEDGNLELKCSIAAQYVIFDRQILEIIEDAYSPNRKIIVQKEELKLPVRLDTRREEIIFEETAQVSVKNIVDVNWCMEYPDMMRINDEAEVSASGQFQFLCLDEEGNLLSTAAKASSKMTVQTDSRNRMEVYSCNAMQPGGVNNAGSILGSVILPIEISSYSEQGLSMVTSLEIGDAVEQDPLRPSLILCRTDGTRLWDVAKKHGSTMDAIKKANQLQDEPLPGQMLLIPVS